ncbi:hypothetical protein K466DRAFT_601803 [Polyporus arcularius HHB13444]|uniref:DUF6534 domain-containing protein n=1 Tax=Polyporus arcularius HHB13444 TaxID=1314778 RepID=A0A5C3P4U1_9APHY|nr:hypothetical protein K466DRAFT_601803 [Polyporus arcularius HHB13444]
MDGPPSLNVLAGPQLMGFLLNWTLQGVLTIQCTFYHTWFPRDNLGLKCLVYGILIYEWVQTGLITAVAFDNFVYGYGSITALTAFHNSWFSVTVMSAIASCVVQSFFAWRIYIIGRSKLLTAVIVTISFCQMAVGVAGGVMLNVVDPSASEASAVTPVIASWLAGAAAVDVVIAVSMTILLLRAKSGLRKSNDLIDKLIRLGIETGTVTAAVAILDLIFFTVLSNTLLHECPALILPKLYSNSLLVSLNNRVFMQRNKDSNTITVDSYPMTGTQLSTLATASVDPNKSGVSLHGDARDRSGLQVHVHEVTLSDRDRTRVGESSVTDAKASQDAFV